MANEKTSAIFDERNKLEDQVGSLQTANMMVQNQLQQLQVKPPGHRIALHY